MRDVCRSFCGYWRVSGKSLSKTSPLVRRARESLTDEREERDKVLRLSEGNEDKAREYHYN